MNDTLFKRLEGQMTPEEEAEFTRRLAAAYRRHEACEKQPEFQRIAKSVEEMLAASKDKGPEDGPEKPE
jgi:hypothetical protein